MSMRCIHIPYTLHYCHALSLLCGSTIRNLKTTETPFFSEKKKNLRYFPHFCYYRVVFVPRYRFALVAVVVVLSPSCVVAML